jgi:spermidine synthase
MGIRALKAIRPDGYRMGIVGLGSGAITAHGRPTDIIRYYEIDPEVKRIAENPDFFTYLSDAKCDVAVEEAGDGRLLLEEERRAGKELYDMILIDAFSSDAIPVHLLTDEAIQLYFDRMTDDGIILLHVSNRHLEFQPLVFELGKKHKAYVMRYEQQRDEIPDHLEDYWFPSIWIALTKDTDSAQALLDAGMFQQGSAMFDVRIWTDQYSNIISLFR